MTNVTLRRFESEDLGRVLELWEREGASRGAADTMTIDQAVDLLLDESTVALLAEIDGELVGMGLASARSTLGRIHRVSVPADDPGAAGLIEQLLGRLEGSLAALGARRIGMLIEEGHPVALALAEREYTATPGARYLERPLAADYAVPTDLGSVRGVVIDPYLWEELTGVDEAKEIIERRVILPLSEPELAARHAVRPPKAIVLFGPPGTGKTTFAKGVASRLGWPFVEIQPSELVGEGPENQARALAEIFDRVLGLPTAVTFVDEVEDLASIRHSARRVSPSVTNEFLKQIPRLRETSHHLLVCATNAVSRLDPAFLRPGRFDYVLPVGPPGADARAAIWRRYVAEITDEQIDVDALVGASDLFTPADIEFAARKAAQLAFEREHFQSSSRRALTDDFLDAIRQTRSTLTSQMVRDFDADTKSFSRY